MQTKALLLLVLSITLAACGSSGNKGNLNEGLLLTVDSSSPHKLTSNTRKSITVNGQTISLVPATEFAANFPQTYSSFGKVELSDGTPYLYSIGEITKLSDMPTSGKATYNGQSLEAGYNLAKNEVYDPLEPGGFTAQVDFANKSIDGVIESNSFEARIEGSSFTGTGDAIKSVEGRFYGPQASEIGGVYYGETSNNVLGDYAIMGSFGGTRGDIKE